MPEITPSDLKMLHDDGKLRFTAEPDGDSPVCRIGDCWFYFAGAEGDEAGADAYFASTPVDDMLRQAADALEGFRTEESLADEHAYYAAIVHETLLAECEQVAEDASNLRYTASFLSENEQFGDDWSHEIASLDRVIAALDDMEACLRAEAERFDERTAHDA